MSQPLPLKVDQIIEDSDMFRTYVFKHNLRAKPGQFVMVWLPGVDEVPMSIGWQDADGFEVGIAKAGDCTTAIFEQIKPGDRLGIRGPYGTAFSLKEEYKKIIVIGGGYGTPPLLSLSQKAIEKGVEVIAILGARNEKYLVYEEKFKKLGCKTLVSTDDGSKGHKGYSTDVLEQVLNEEAADCVYTCGPEKMMVKVAEMAQVKGMDCEVSLERYMKCGFGICGQCCMDNTGIRICKDGPVLRGESALAHPEFGKYTRTASGIVKEI
ncbi:dihydroorotate dehydrogenase electron transfer subunit [Candidatus Peregrinibacteria bacterium]|nr:MAG: dihydroorotate dehydrogenase electron transfer subunit [Candidatus Peregrinibacteria bacterium]